jgi:streptomycin 6-kinase
VIAIRIPQRLVDVVDEDDYPERLQWLAALPEVVNDIASGWELERGEPYLPGGQCAWVAPARNPAGDELALKVGWRHREAEHEADARRFWDPFGSLRDMCDQWDGWFELDFDGDNRGLDPGLAREGIATLGELPRTAVPSVLLSTDLHAGNVLAGRREPWLVIDPKPFIARARLSPRPLTVANQQPVASKSQQRLNQRYPEATLETEPLLDGSI